MKHFFYFPLLISFLIFNSCDKFADSEHGHESIAEDSMVSLDFYLNGTTDNVDSWTFLSDLNQAPIPVEEQLQIPAYVSAIYWEEITEDVLNNGAVFVYVETVPGAWELLPISSPIGETPYGVTFEAVITIDDERGGSVQFLWIGNDVTQALPAPAYNHVRVVVIK